MASDEHFEQASESDFLAHLFGVAEYHDMLPRLEQLVLNAGIAEGHRMRARD